jgi:hypothetical protein
MPPRKGKAVIVEYKDSRVDAEWHLAGRQLVRSARDAASSSHRWAGSWLGKAFLPVGYPDAVSADYTGGWPAAPCGHTAAPHGGMEGLQQRAARL